MRKATNQLLRKAKKSKSDEFYTQLCDIERELQYYKVCFADKVVYCNCDDYRVSNFFKYFVENFKNLRLKKVIATCYIEQGNGLCCEYAGLYEDMKITQLQGDGSFKSSECIEILKQSDIIVTNPPFSLFREFVSQIVHFDKEFLIIGNINSITYKSIFELIQNNKAWLGVNMGRGISGFIVPKNYEAYGTETHINENGETIISTNSCLWLTNLEFSQRYNTINLVKTYYGNEKDFPKYDNCVAINVNKTQNIPKDYDGLIGVPITFLHKYNPKQFKIIRFRKGDDGKDLCINGKTPYFRILIKKL